MKNTKDSIKVITKPLNYGSEILFRNADDLEISLDVLGGGSGNPTPPVNGNEKTPEQLAAEQAAAAEAQRIADEEKARLEAEAAANAGGTGGGDDKSANEKLEKVQNELLTKYNGTSFNDEGDMLDANGNVIKKFEEFESEIVLDDEESTPLVETVRTKLGYELKDENGNPKVYTDSEDGIVDLVKDAASTMSKQLVDNVFNTHPDVRDLLNHIQAGGTVQDWKSSVISDYSNVEIKKDNIDVQRQVVRENLRLKGYNDDKIEKYIKMFEDGGTLLDEAKDSQKEITTAREQQRLNNEQLLKVQEEEARKEQIKYWTDINQIVTKGNIKDISIPDADRGKFYDYLSKAVNGNGMSQNMIDSSKEDTETQLLMSYYRFKGYSFKDLALNIAKDEKVKSLRERFTKRETSNNGTPRKPIETVNPNSLNIDISKIY